MIKAFYKQTYGFILKYKCFRNTEASMEKKVIDSEVFLAGLKALKADPKYF
jgi:hypothetical protein